MAEAAPNVKVTHGVTARLYACPAQMIAYNQIIRNTSAYNATKVMDSRKKLASVNYVKETRGQTARQNA